MNDFQAPSDNPRIAVRVRRKAVSFVRSGHPWLFEDSVERVSRGGAPGDVAILFDDARKVIGAGLYDPASLVRVKILTHGSGAPPVGQELFARIVAEAAGRRAGKISADTDAWRLLHGESDGVPGLVADKYAETLVFKVYTPAWLPWLGQIRDALFAANSGLHRTILRLSREVQSLPSAERLGLDEAAVFPAGEDFDGIQRFHENGLMFEADLKTGQKTGFFLDQRDNRARVGALARGRSVLNVFSYTGGFSLYAARGGASEVVSLDFNKHAIAGADRNFALNREIPAVAACRHTGVVGDAFDVMARMSSEMRMFDLVIVDPPSFAKAAAEKETALRSYAALAKLASRLVRPHGILVFASCSSRVTADELFPTVLDIAAGTGRPLEEFDRAFHAADHPARFPESNYLKCLYARRLR